MYSPEDLKRALEAMEAGCKLSKAAQRFNIPTATLFHKFNKSIQNSEDDLSVYSIQFNPEILKGDPGVPQTSKLETPKLETSKPVTPKFETAKSYETNICCACLSENLYTLHSLTDKDQGVFETFMTLIPEKFWCDLNVASLQICSTCVRKVKLIKEFIKVCSQSFEKLKALQKPEVEVVIKFEEVDVNSLESYQDDHDPEMVSHHSTSAKPEDQCEDESEDQSEEVEYEYFELDTPIEPIDEELIPNDLKLNGGFCTLCEDFFNGCEKAHQLKKHCKTSGKGLFKCKVCDCQSFDTEESFIAHINYEHIRFRTPVKCPSCRQIYKFKRALRLHLKSHENEVICSFCERKFTTKKLLDNHIKREHEIYRTCKICNEKVLNGEVFQLHQRSHKRVQCNWCGDVVTNQARLDVHLKEVHRIDSNNPFICDLCNETFFDMNKLRYHMEAKHIVEPSKTLCPHCGKNFSHKYYLKKHIDAIHLNIETASKRMKECPHCGKLKVSLWNHIERAHGDSKWQCHQCPRTFKAKSLLSRHMYSHLQQKPYNCHLDGCSYGSFGILPLKDHYRKVHELDLTHKEAGDFCVKVSIDAELLKQSWEHK